MDSPGLVLQTGAAAHVSNKRLRAELDWLPDTHLLWAEIGIESTWVNGFSQHSRMPQSFFGVASSPGHGMTSSTPMYGSTTSPARLEVKGKRPRDDAEWDLVNHQDPPPVMTASPVTAELLPGSGFDAGNNFPFSPIFTADGLHFPSHPLTNQFWTATAGPGQPFVMSQPGFLPYSHDSSRSASDDGALFSPDPSASADTSYVPPAASGAYDPSFAFLGEPSFPVDDVPKYDSSAVITTRASDLQLNWELVARVPSEEGVVDYLDSGAAPSGSISPTNSVSPTSESWQKIPSYTDDATEVVVGHVTPPKQPRQLSRSPKKHNRRQLKPEEREQTGKTRQIGACMRCQMQRVRCLPNPNPKLAERGICKTCSDVALESKKVIHRLPCRRGKLTEAVLFRVGGLNLTKRWTGAEMKDLGREDWVSHERRTIKMSLGLCDEPLEMEVRKFKPISGDVIARSWRDRNGNTMRTYIEPYALADILRSAQEFRAFVNANAFSAVQRYTERPDVHDLVSRTYRAAWDYMKSANFESTGVNSHAFMSNLFRLWFANRNTMGSSQIVGDDKLDMVPETHPDYPLPGRISVPRMICQQIDSINYNYSLKPLREEVLKDLWRLIQGKDPQCFFMIYLVVFVLLHEASAICKDRRRHAIDNSSSLRYTVPEFVEDLQESTTIILMFWHYYKRGLDPLTTNWETMKTNPGKGIVYRDLAPSQIALMKELSEISMLKVETDPEFGYSTGGDFAWEHDLFFVRQMFEPGWHPKRTWTR